MTEPELADLARKTYTDSGFAEVNPSKAKQRAVAVVSHEGKMMAHEAKAFVERALRGEV